jgi:hypothetical protein
MINCSSDPYASYSNVSECVCVAGFIWNSVLKRCTKNCSIDGAEPLASIDPTKCVCVTNFIW